MASPPASSSSSSPRMSRPQLRHNHDSRLPWCGLTVVLLTCCAALLPLSLLLSFLPSSASAFVVVPSSSSSCRRREAKICPMTYNTGLALIRLPTLKLEEGRMRRGGQCLSARSDGDGDGDDDDDQDDIDLSGQDWRAFRAQLVMSSEDRKAGTGTTDAATDDDGEEEDDDDPDDVDGIGRALFGSSSGRGGNQQERFNIVKNSEQWAYDSGNVIEQGAVILGGVEQEFGFGLRQQYFHKAAILVLDHDDNKFTKGIILNRPSDRMLVDPDNPDIKWRVWFGGDVQFLDSIIPDIVCLHSLRTEAADKVSTTVMKDIQWTTFDGAKKLVNSGDARPSDFWVFCGYAGWAPKQLMGELERKSWYMVATDSQTLLKELARQGSTADPRDAGLDTWELLMNMIGRGETAKESKGEFDDLMLKEWARKNLISENVLAAKALSVGVGRSSEDKGGTLNPVDKLLKRARGMGTGEGETEVSVGGLVRASSEDRSPFLLSRQEFHKSIVLVLSDDDNLTTGVILNHPASMGVDIQIQEEATGSTKTVKIPLRFGGEYRIKGQTPELLWLHCSDKMRSAGIGSPIGTSSSGVFSCTAEQASKAIGRGIAEPTEFMVVSGVSVWTKGERGTASRGMQGEVAKGHFEVVPSNRVSGVWEILLSQELLSGINLHKMLSIGNRAWEEAGALQNGKQEDRSNSRVDPVMDGLGEGYDEEDDTLVFKSDVKVATLSDSALRSWVATFLLGVPDLR